MHIVFNGWFWDQPHTGSGQYIRRLLHALGRAAPDLQMTLVLPPHNSAPDDLPEKVSLVTTRGRGGHVGKVWFEQRTFPQMAGRVGADIAHVPYWGPPLVSPIPLVTSVLDVIPLALPEYSRGLGVRLYTSLAAAAARGSAHTITLSQAAKADIVRFLGLSEDSITPIYLAADEVYHPRLGAENDQAVRRKYDLPEQFVLYLGGFDRRKNVNQLLLAYTYVGQAEGDNIPLVIAGREPQWGAPLFPDQRRYAADLNISDYVRWLGYVDEADKPALYRLASVFAFPTLYEGFGLMALEAMACGTPVITSDAAALPEVVGDAALTVPPEDGRQIRIALEKVLANEYLARKLRALGLERAAKFSWRETARKTVAVYDEVIAEAEKDRAL